MVRSYILRIPVVRAFTSRLSQPLLPLTTRLASRTTPSLSGSRPFSHFPARLTSSPPPSSRQPNEEPDYGLPPNASLSQRLKHLIKSYGWYALGVYAILSAVDFSVAFAAVNVFGADHVARIATEAKEWVVSLIHSSPPEPGREEMDHAHAASGGHEGLMAMIIVAYTIHKTLFLPVRIGLTAAATPRLVHWLRSRGWAGSAGARRAAQEVRDKIRDRQQRD